MVLTCDGYQPKRCGGETRKQTDYLVLLLGDLLDRFSDVVITYEVAIVNPTGKRRVKRAVL